MSPSRQSSGTDDPSRLDCGAGSHHEVQRELVAQLSQRAKPSEGSNPQRASGFVSVPGDEGGFGDFDAATFCGCAVVLDGPGATDRGLAGP